jgi:hypothetical protein
MMKVLRYFHIRPLIEQETAIRGTIDALLGITAFPRGGATVRVEGDTDNGPVRVQVTLCSFHDNFVKKTGRKFADSKPVKTIPLNQLPHLLAKVNDKVKRRRPTAVKRIAAAYVIDYSFATKYFQPKKA